VIGGAQLFLPRQCYRAMCSEPARAGSAVTEQKVRSSILGGALKSSAKGTSASSAGMHWLRPGDLKDWSAVSLAGPVKARSGAPARLALFFAADANLAGTNLECCAYHRHLFALGRATQKALSSHSMECARSIPALSDSPAFPIRTPCGFVRRTDCSSRLGIPLRSGTLRHHRRPNRVYF